MESTSNLPLPEAFLDFLDENGLNPSIYAASCSIPRYIRVRPGCESELEEFEAEIKRVPEKVDWLPNFYMLPPHIPIAKTKAYQEGKIYGIDAASGAAVLALEISSGDHVLDLCAAPGVDVATHRLAACRNLLQKYALGDRCRLFAADGTTFSLTPLRVPSNSKSALHSESNSDGKFLLYKEWTSRIPWKERKRLTGARGQGSSLLVSQNQEPELVYYGRYSGVVGISRAELYQTVSGSEVSQCGYDKVLVDAECTHDGSIRHIQKFESWGWTTLQRRVLDAERTDGLTALQFHLLTSGFKLLRVGGFLVYSTCSLTYAQNEDVVERFLLQNASADLVEIDAARFWPCKSGRIPKTLRFDPVTSGTSGLFVAKFTKSAI